MRLALGQLPHVQAPHSHWLRIGSASGSCRSRVVDPGVVQAVAAPTHGRCDSRAAGADVRVTCGDFRDLTPADLPPGPGLILSNPPYGERVGDDVVDLYEDLRHWLRQFSGWRAAFLVANREFEDVMGMRPTMKKPISIRPLNGYIYVYQL